MAKKYDQIDILGIRYRIIAYPPGKQPIEFISLCDSISHTEHKGQFSATLDVSLKNIKEKEHGWFHGKVHVMTPIKLQAMEDEKGDWRTIFYGMVVKRTTNAKNHTIDLQCQDLLYQMLQSDISMYIKEDTSMETALKDIAKEGGVTISRMDGISGKLPKKIQIGTLASAFEFVLEEYSKKHSDDYVIRSDMEGKVEIVKVGGNSTVYELTDWGVGDSSHEFDISDIVTQVDIYSGGEGEDDKPSFKKSHKGNTQYGVVKRIIKESKDKESEAEKEAKQLLKDEGKPKQVGKLMEVPDIPWIRKGDKVLVASGTLGSYRNNAQHSVPMIVRSVDRDIEKRTMSLTFEL